MTQDEYQHYNGTGTHLTREHLEQGWHYCNEWDGLLLQEDGSNEPCSCKIKAFFKARTTEKY